MCKLLNGLLFLVQLTLIASQLTDKQKCKITNSACIIKSANELIPYFTAGIPEFDIERLDVMSVDIININLSGLQINMTDLKCKGLKKTVIDDIKFDVDNKVLQLVYHTNISVTGKYVANGRLLILPITGDGNAIIKLKNLHVDAKMPYAIKKNKDGKDVLELKTIKYDFDIKDNAYFEFSNLYNGNKVGSDLFHQFVNNNWRDVANEFGHPTLKTPLTRIYEAIKKYFMSQPLENFVLS